MKVTPLYIIMLALWIGTVMFLTDKLMIKLLPKQVNTNNHTFHVTGNSYTTNYVENGVNVIVITWTNGVGSFTLEKKENYEHTYN